MEKMYLDKRLQEALMNAVEEHWKKSFGLDASSTLTDALKRLAPAVQDLSPDGGGVVCDHGLRARFDEDGRLYFFREEEKGNPAPSGSAS